MQCFYPIHLKNGNVVPCGKCANCLNRYRSEWAWRVAYELQFCKRALWFRLSYSNENLPYKEYFTNSQDEVLETPHNKNYSYVMPYGYLPRLVDVNRYPKFLSRVISYDDAKLFYPFSNFTVTLSKTQIQDWLDKIQHKLKRLGFGTIKYFLCGEYGSNNLRPHYHVALLTYNKVDDKLLEDTINDSWKLGEIHMDYLRHPSQITYSTKYQLLKSRRPPGSYPPFSLKSKGFASTFLKDDSNLEYMYDKVYTFKPLVVSQFESDVKITLPRYLKNKIMTQVDVVLQEQYKYVQEQRNKLKNSEFYLRNLQNYMAKDGKYFNDLDVPIKLQRYIERQQKYLTKRADRFKHTETDDE